MIATVWKETTFDAAHHLPHYKGACVRVHGHTYKVQVGITGKIGEHNGMVIDMKTLGQALDKQVATWDHQNLNDFFQMPTAELMAEELLINMQYAFSDHEVTVRLWETPTSWVEIHS